MLKQITEIIPVFLGLEAIYCILTGIQTMVDLVLAFGFFNYFSLPF